MADLPIPDDDAPTEIDAADLMDAPEGTVRSGDEFHRPENWVRCARCGVDCPHDSETCFNCGASLVE